MAATRRRRSSRHSGNFFTRHWKSLVAVLLAIILIFVVLKWVVPAVGNLFSGNSQVTGQTGVVTIDGRNIGVFDTPDEATANPTTITAGNSAVKVSGKGNIQANASIGGFPVGILSNQGVDTFTMNTDGIGDGTIVLVNVLVGGDGSFFGQAMSNEVDVHYFAVQVSNPTQQSQNVDPSIQTAQTLGIPNGTVYVDGTTFETYGSEWDAQQAVAGKQNQFTVPVQYVTNGLPITVVPNTDKTARVFIRVCLADSVNQYEQLECACSDTNWAATINVSKFAGQQIVLMIKAENGWGTCNGYSYISFFLPEIEGPTVG